MRAKMVIHYRTGGVYDPAAGVLITADIMGGTLVIERFASGRYKRRFSPPTMELWG